VKPKLILMGVGAALVLTGAWFFFLWKPAGADLEEARAEKVAAEQQATQLQARLAHLKKLEQNAEVLEQNRSLLATAIPSTDKLDEFILQVNERATRAGVSFVSVAPTPPSAPSGGSASAASAVTLQLQVSGDYFQVMRFLEEMRDGPRLLTIDSFSITPAGADGKMTASIGSRMFVNPSAAAAATPVSQKG
jgi:Tfp pilus assembly protein PilO